MSKEFEADIKRTKGKEPNSDQKERKDRDLEGTEADPPTEEDAPEESPLKTVGGTPIIERPPEG
jgi:hypothetical protein